MGTPGWYEHVRAESLVKIAKVSACVGNTLLGMYKNKIRGRRSHLPLKRVSFCAKFAYKLCSE